MKTDVLIIGGGPAGAASAMFLIEQGIKNLLNRAMEREQSYANDANDNRYSIPIGSRFHPERAPIWEADASVGLTEAWMSAAS